MGQYSIHQYHFGSISQGDTKPHRSRDDINIKKLEIEVHIYPFIYKLIWTGWIPKGLSEAKSLYRTPSSAAAADDDDCGAIILSAL